MTGGRGSAPWPWWCGPTAREVHAEGTCDGEIAPGPKGDGGFGYDSVFVPSAGDGRSFAQMTAVEKDALSHRGQAFSALLAELLGHGDPRRDEA